MIAVVCVDDRNGTMFRGRRQSQDRLLRDDLLSICPGTLRMNAYSAKLFSGCEDRLAVTENFLELAQAGEWCFVEGRSLEPLADKLEALVLYRWNRAYPADAHLDVPMENFLLMGSYDFPGSSHEMLTRETYQRPAPPPEEERPAPEPERPAPPPPPPPPPPEPPMAEVPIPEFTRSRFPELRAFWNEPPSEDADPEG